MSDVAAWRWWVAYWVERGGYAVAGAVLRLWWLRWWLLFVSVFTGTLGLLWWLGG